MNSRNFFSMCLIALGGGLIIGAVGHMIGIPLWATCALGVLWGAFGAPMLVGAPGDDE